MINNRNILKISGMMSFFMSFIQIVLLKSEYICIRLQTFVRIWPIMFLLAFLSSKIIIFPLVKYLSEKHFKILNDYKIKTILVTFLMCFIMTNIRNFIIFGIYFDLDIMNLLINYCLALFLRIVVVNRIVGNK